MEKATLGGFHIVYMVYFEAFYWDFLSSKNPEIGKSEHQGVRKQIFLWGAQRNKKNYILRNFKIFTP